MIRIALLFSVLILPLLGATTLETMKREARVAIVVGNSSYDEHPLKAATENARDVRNFLEKSGFYVYYGENLDKRNFIRLLRKFNKRMRPGGIGLVYFCGHMVQTRGSNYLLPVDNGIEEEAMIPRQGIRLNTLFTGMREAHNRLNIIILDGVKASPFGSLFAMGKASYAPISYAEEFTTLIASRPGRIDSTDTFTRDFLSLAQKRGAELKELNDALGELRQKNGAPQPQITLAKKRPFYFSLPDRLPTEDELAYAEIKKSSSKKEIEAFIGRYPKSPFAAEAQQLLKTLVEAEALEKQRRELEALAAEATRKQQEESKRAKAENAVITLSGSQSEAPVRSPKNEIGITLTKPGAEEKTAPEKPKEGEERHILLQ